LQQIRAGSGAPPEVSVVVVNWNRREMLRGCLESLMRQEGPSFEIVVVDNGSSDGSAEMVESLKNSAKMRVLILKNAENRGFCAANNQGIAAASGKYVALLNNDAEAEPGWLQAMLSVVARHPDAGMIASKIVVYEDPARIDKAGHLIWPDGQNRGRGTGQIDCGQYDREEEVLWPDGCAALYRKAMLDEIGGFDEDLFAYADDAELGLRARLAGWTCWYAPGAVVRHRRGATLGLLSARRLELIERNRVLLAVKHFPASLLWCNLPYFVLRLAGGAVAGLRGRGEAGRFAGPVAKLRMTAALLRGFAAGIAMIPRTWRKRRAMQPLRKLGPREARQLLMQHRISLRELSEGAN
jgi:GT2 family glycosyltransferase